MEGKEQGRIESRPANTRNCCTTSLSKKKCVVNLKNDLIKNLLSVLVLDLCFLRKKSEGFIMELMEF
jgi:hypothetical protein